MSRIISFRGLMADGTQERILLKTKEGLKGYRIVKFSLMCKEPGVGNQESVVKVYKVKQALPIATANAAINFSDGTLLAAGIFTASTNQKTDPEDLAIIFESEVFNQDIFVTHTDNEGALDINYYLELEAMELDLNESTVATLKNMRNTSTPG
jgi:hypothetical protein